MRVLKVLVGCECSGEVREAFRALGHDAWSCDLQAADDNSEFHIQGDLFEALKSQKWDLAIMHPPCTYISVSGMHRTTRGLRPRKLTDDALDFVRDCMNADVPYIAIENPISVISTNIRKPDQIVQPYQFGDDASKSTCLWLKHLPKLPIAPDKRVPGRKVEYPVGSGKIKERWANQTDSGQNRLGPSEDRAKNRSKTYPGIASAMADTWSKHILNNE